MCESINKKNPAIASRAFLNNKDKGFVMNDLTIAYDYLIEQTIDQIENWYSNDYLASMAEYVYCPMCELDHQDNTNCQRG